MAQATIHLVESALFRPSVLSCYQVKLDRWPVACHPPKCIHDCVCYTHDLHLYPLISGLVGHEWFALSEEPIPWKVGEEAAMDKWRFECQHWATRLRSCSALIYTLKTRAQKVALKPRKYLDTIGGWHFPTVSPWQHLIANTDWVAVNSKVSLDFGAGLWASIQKCFHLLGLLFIIYCFYSVQHPL